MELLEQVPNLDAILVPVNGGGLISGIALYAKDINPAIRIFACVPEGKMLAECLSAGERLWSHPPRFLETKCEGNRAIVVDARRFIAIGRGERQKTFLSSMSFTTVRPAAVSDHVLARGEASVYRP